MHSACCRTGASGDASEWSNASAADSGRADHDRGAHIDKAAQLLRQSQGVFLARVGEEAAKRILLQWAVEQYAADGMSLSELAAQTELPLEAIAQQLAERRAEDATAFYLASCRQLAQTSNNPKFYTAAKKAVRQALEERRAAKLP